MGDKTPSGTRWHGVAALAARQHGIVSRAQLRGLGVGDGAIATALATGRLHASFRGAFGVGHPPVGERARMTAAVLACGRGAVVSHLTAAHLLGLRDQRPSAIHVIAPGEAGRGIDGIRRHCVSAPGDAERGHCDAVPCTSPSRTIVDLAGMLGERSLRGVVERAAVREMLDVAATEGIMAMGRRRGAPLLRRILSDWRSNASTEVDEQGPDLRSALEARLLALVRAAGLPAPHCNRLLTVGERRFLVDFLWPDHRLVVESDGKRFHHNPVAFERDRLRDRALQIGGYRVLRFTHRQITTEPDAVTEAIGELLRATIAGSRVAVPAGGAG